MFVFPFKDNIDHETPGVNPKLTILRSAWVLRGPCPLGALRERMAYMHFDNRGKSVRESHH